jgi:hypothetical protein
MPTESIIANDLSIQAFPFAETSRRLRLELEMIAEAGSVIRPEWAPKLDSLTVAGIALVVEELFPAITFPPDKIVRKGGYQNVDEAVEDMIPRIKKIWEKHAKSRTRK